MGYANIFSAAREETFLLQLSARLRFGGMDGLGLDMDGNRLPVRFLLLVLRAGVVPGLPCGSCFCFRAVGGREPILSSFCYVCDQDNFCMSCAHLWPKTCAQPGGTQGKVTFPTACRSLAIGLSLCCFTLVHFIFKYSTPIFMKSFGLHIST